MRHLKQLFAALLLLCTTLTAGAQSYNLKYKVDGKDYVTYSLSAGETISHPTAPVKEGHTFLGWSTSTSLEQIDLASNADAMLYSNAPCKTDQYGDQFAGWDVLFDGRDDTFFHSDYSGQDSEDGLDHYLRVDMGEGNALSIFTFSYRNRNTNSSKNAPATIIVEGSNDVDGEYEVIATLSALPSANSAVYESTLLGNGNAYRYIRFRVVATQLNEMQGGHPFFFISEFEMYQVAPAPATMPASDLTLYARFRMYNSDIEQDGIFYKFLDEEARTVVVTSCQSSFTGYSGALNIPATVTLNGEEYTVVGIEEGVLSAGNVTSVSVPGTFKSLGARSFAGCKNLTSVTLSNEIISIGDCAFQGCTSLESLEIPNGVEVIGYGAFRDCNALASITIPNSVTRIDQFAFSNCKSLRQIEIPSGVSTIEYASFYKCINLENVTIPVGVTAIGGFAFSNCYSITDIDIPNGVTTIGEYAFQACELTHITIPASVTSIEEKAFNICENLKTVINFSNLTFSKGSTDNGYVAAYANKVYNVPNGSMVGDYVFGTIDGINTLVAYIGNDTELVLPANYNGENYIIGRSVFEFCTSLTSVEIPNSVTSIGYAAFGDCTGLINVVIGNNVTSIEEWAFNECSNLTNIVIPNSVTSIGYGAFERCTSFTSVEIPNNVTNIGELAFVDCSGLTSIEIPNSVTSIGIYAFSGCSSLTSIVVADGNTVYDSRDNCNAIIETATNTLLTGCQNTLIPNSVTSIGSSAFSGCSGLTSIEIPNSVTSIGEGAFSGCSGLTSVEIPNSVTSIGNYAFSGCTGLTSVTIGNSVTSIGDSAFYGCSGLTSVTVGNSVTSIGDSAFKECSKLKTIINLSNLNIRKGTSLYGNIARYADTIYSVPNGFVQGDFIFSRNEGVNTLLYYLGNATDLTLPLGYYDYPYVIGADVFKNNTTLTRVVISRSVVGFEELAFSGCTNLKTIVNFSELTLTAGSEDNGCVALYADKVVNAPGGYFVNGDYVFTIVDDVDILVGYIGDETELPLPRTARFDYTIGAAAFAGDTNITSLKIPSTVTAVQADAFLGCTSLNAVYIDDLAAWCNIDFQDVGNSNPLNNAHNLYVNGELLTELVIPDGITEIKDATFRGCNKITSLTIPEGVTSIGRYAFNTCTALTEVTFPESLTTLHRGAFSGCIALEVVVLPAAVTELEYSVFMACSSLADITSLATTPPAIVNGSFTNIAENATLYVPRDCGAAYAATEWSQIPNIVELAFNVVYKVNGEVYATDRIDYGAAVTPVADPEVLGYTFIEWDGLPDYMPRHDIEVNAVFEKNSDFITLNQTGTTVYTSHFALDFSEVEGLKAYAATGYDTATGEITMTRVKKVNAGVGLYLVGEVSATYAVPYIDYSTSYSLNMLVGVLNKTMVNSYSDDGIYANYRYVKKSGDTQFKFYQAGDGNTVSAGKAYLQIPVAWLGGVASETVGIRFDDGEFTDIEEMYDEVEGADGKVEVVYDLQGRVVENPTNGIYIINGKKVLIK